MCDKSTEQQRDSLVGQLKQAVGTLRRTPGLPSGKNFLRSGEQVLYPV